MEFSGRVALITGGGSGVGEATARLFAAGGATVGLLTGGVPAKPEDIADAIGMLASDQARHVAGALLFVDGGQSLLR